MAKREQPTEEEQPIVEAPVNKATNYNFADLKIMRTVGTGELMSTA